MRNVFHHSQNYLPSRDMLCVGLNLKSFLFEKQGVDSVHETIHCSSHLRHVHGVLVTEPDPQRVDQATFPHENQKLTVQIESQSSIKSVSQAKWQVKLLLCCVTHHRHLQYGFLIDGKQKRLSILLGLGRCSPCVDPWIWLRFGHSMPGSITTNQLKWEMVTDAMTRVSIAA